MHDTKYRWFDKVRAENGLPPMLPASEARKGELNGSHKLTWEQVRAMRADYADGVPTRLLVAKYGIGKSQVHNIVSGKQWPEPKGRAS